MTVAELIAKLQQLPQDALVACAGGHIEETQLASDVQVFDGSYVGHPPVQGHELAGSFSERMHNPERCTRALMVEIV